MDRKSPAVITLLIANIAVFLVGHFLPNGNDRIIETSALWFPQNPHFGWWQVASYMFLHGTFSHILFNMFAVVSFGTILERQWGAARFLIFYFVCGIGAGVIQLGVNGYEFTQLHAHLLTTGMTPADLAQILATGSGQIPADPALKAKVVELYGLYNAPTLGASGAVYGLLVAFACLYPNAKLSLMFIPVPIAAKIFIPIVIALDLLSGITGFSLFGGGIAHFAHVGGALIGFLLMLLWRHHRHVTAETSPSREP